MGLYVTVLIGNAAMVVLTTPPALRALFSGEFAAFVAFGAAASVGVTTVVGLVATARRLRLVGYVVNGAVLVAVACMWGSECYWSRSLWPSPEAWVPGVVAVANILAVYWTLQDQRPASPE